MHVHFRAVMLLELIRIYGFGHYLGACAIVHIAELVVYRISNAELTAKMRAEPRGGGGETRRWPPLPLENEVSALFL